MANVRELPIHKRLPDILNLIAENQVVVLAAETGTGKTTVIPPALLYAGARYTVVTGPRRLGVQMCAEYVARTQGMSEDDHTIGFQHKYDKRRTNDTRLCYVTEGILLQELRDDPTLTKYDVVIVDEVHERSVNCDMLLLYLRLALEHRDDLRLVIMSATLNAGEYAAYFKTDAICDIQGRQFPVSLSYEPKPLTTHKDIFREMIGVIRECVESEVEGDVLVFLPDEASIQRVKQLLKQSVHDRFQVFELMSAQSKDDRSAALGPCPVRKIILSTNIAETSVTLEGVVFVIDSCLIKQDYYVDAYLGGLAVTNHSQAGLNQRKGRAGRVRSGYCHRMLTESQFNALPEYTEPQILRVPLADVLLGLYERGFTYADVQRMEFLTPPPQQRWEEARELLVEFKYIDANDVITPRGRLILDMGISPLYGLLIVAGEKFECLAEMLLFVAALSQQNTPYFNVQGWENEHEVTEKRNTMFVDSSSDFLSFLKCFLVFDRLESVYERRSFGREYGVNVRVLDEIKRDWLQLMDRMNRGGVAMTSLFDGDKSYEEFKDEISYVLLVSLRHHLAAYQRSTECYTRDRDGNPKAILVFPGSFVRYSSGVALLYAYERDSKRLYAHWCHQVPIEMVIECADKYLTRQVTVSRSVISVELYLNGLQMRALPVEELSLDTSREVRQKVYFAYASFSFGSPLVERVGNILQQIRETLVADCLLERLGDAFGEGTLNQVFASVNEEQLHAVVDKFCSEERLQFRGSSEFVEYDRLCVSARAFVAEYGHFVSTNALVAIYDVDVVTLPAVVRATEQLVNALAVAHKKLPTMEEMALARLKMHACAEVCLTTLLSMMSQCPLCGEATLYDKNKRQIVCTEVARHHFGMVGHFADPTDVVVQEVYYSDRDALCTTATLMRGGVYRVSVPLQFLSVELEVRNVRSFVTTTVQRAIDFTADYLCYEAMRVSVRYTQELVRGGQQVLTFTKDARGYYANEDTSVRLLPMSLPKDFDVKFAYVCEVYRPTNMRSVDQVVRRCVVQLDIREIEALRDCIIERYPEFSSHVK